MPVGDHVGDPGLRTGRGNRWVVREREPEDAARREMTDHRARHGQLGSPAQGEGTRTGGQELQRPAEERHPDTGAQPMPDLVVRPAFGTSLTPGEHPGLVPGDCWRLFGRTPGLPDSRYGVRAGRSGLLPPVR
jgi:hypothetical protein